MGEYDCIIIGGGLSGLSAGVRMAHFGRRVVLFESHCALGGLNSYYRRGDAIYDTGLHAMTNFVPPGDSSAPLNRVLRQLRLSRGELQLCPQSHSTIVFPGNRVVLNNDFDAFVRQLKEQFPQCSAGIERLMQRIAEVGYSGKAPAGDTARSVIVELTANRRLADMICLPVMYYGNPQAGDMDFSTFAIMFNSVLREGFCRPRDGIYGLLQALKRRFLESGGELHCSCGIRRLVQNDAADDVRRGILAAVDVNGSRHSATHFISTIGAPETRALIDGDVAGTPLEHCRAGGCPGFIECVFDLPAAPSELGFAECVEFICSTDEFEFQPPQDVFSRPSSILLCAPGNYIGCEANHTFRASFLTQSGYWLRKCGASEYRDDKRRIADTIIQMVGAIYPGLVEKASCRDVATPRTLRRFTGHANGALYGSPDKLADGRTGWENLRLAGTDQGLCGIVGAMLSGILAANALLTT